MAATTCRSSPPPWPSCRRAATRKWPVKTRFGYHIILLEDTRPVEFPPYDQVKDRVQQEMMKQARDKKIEELRAAAKVE